MSIRLLLEIAIRVLGVWLVATAISNIAAAVYLFVPGPWSPTPSLVIVTVFPIVVRGAVGGMLLWWAPWIAARFYPAGSEEGQVHLRVGPGDIYRVACFVLGAYFLVRTAEPASRLVVSLIQGVSQGMPSAWQSWQSGQLVADALVAMAYLAAGLLLVFGSRPIAELLSNLRYDPDTIPKQQISLAVLLALLLVCGLVLGILRWLMAGGL